MRRTAVRLACVVGGGAMPLVAPPVASADPAHPAHDVGRGLPAADSTAYAAPTSTATLGRTSS